MYLFNYLNNFLQICRYIILLKIRVFFRSLRMRYMYKDIMIRKCFNIKVFSLTLVKIYLEFFAKNDNFLREKTTIYKTVPNRTRWRRKL